MDKDSPRDELYEFAPEAQPRKASSKPPIPNPKTTTPVTLSYLAPKDEPRVIADTDTIKNLYMPLGLLAGGVLIEIVAGLLRTGKPVAALGYVAVELGLGTIGMLAGILIAAKYRGIEIGRFWTVVFKLTAISVAPAAAVDLVSPFLQLIPILGGLLALVVEFVLYFALLGALFDLDESDTWYCVCIIFIVHLVMAFALMGIGARW